MKAADTKGAGWIPTKAPAAATNTDVVMFTATNASKANALPDGFCGQFVRIQPIGTDMYYFFAVEAATATGVAPTAVIALPPAATDAGAQATTQGELIKSGAVLEVEVPFCGAGQAVYFCRWGVTGGQSVQLTKASGKPGDNFNP